MGRKQKFYRIKNSERKPCLEQFLIELPTPWNDHSPEDLKNIVVCRVSSSKTVPLTVTHCVKIMKNLSWSLFVNQHEVDVSKCSALSDFPQKMTVSSFLQLLSDLNKMKNCVGNADCHFVSMLSSKKGKVVSPDGSIAAYVDEELGSKTVRTTGCEFVSTNIQCERCSSYRTNLRAMYSRWSKGPSFDGSDTSNHTNERYLNSPQKKMKMTSLKKEAVAAKAAVKRLKEKIMRIQEQQSESVSNGLNSDLTQIMNDNVHVVHKTYPENSFARLFFDEQIKAASVKDRRQVRWHPLLIKWCLNLKLLSSSAYSAMRTSGFLTLPSERTLRDYVHYFEHRPGFQKEVNELLLQEMKVDVLPENKRYVCLILDEMKIKEGLVYNKYSGEMIGFTDIGDINNELLQLERGEEERPQIADHVLVIMVRGIFIKLNFPYAHFSTRGVTGDCLYPIVWEAIEILEASNVKVLCITADGASPNRKFFNMHKVSGAKLTYKTKNPYAKDDRSVFFLSDPPHLIKTVRNCWSHSGNSGTRHMEVNGGKIEWKHMWDLFNKLSSISCRSTGLTLAPKLKMEHLQLTSYSRMRVDLAAQVLSKTVADLFAYFEDPSTNETMKFVATFDKFFDCVNVRSKEEWVRKKKPDLKPYLSASDPRFKWLEEDFLGYLDIWESSVQAKDIPPVEKQKLLLSRETLDGLRITVKSFVEMGKYLLSDTSDGLFLLSERFSQDPLENYFGQQRARGGRNEHPNLQQCLHNAAAIRIQKSIATDPVRGNCKRKRYLNQEQIIDDTPLPKRKRHNKQ